MPMPTDAQLRQQEIYRAMCPSKRIDVACSLHDFAYERLFQNLRARNPEMPVDQVRLETAIRFLNESEGILRESFESA